MNKYQLKDIVEIINYGQIIEFLDSHINLFFPNAKLYDIVVRETGPVVYKWDFHPELVGEKAVVFGIIDNGVSTKYKLFDISMGNDLYLFDEEQLKLIAR